MATDKAPSPMHDLEKKKFRLDVTRFCVEIAGFTAVVMSVLYLGRQTHEVATQTKLSAEAIRNNAYVNMSSWTLELDKALVDNHELRKFFVAGIPIEKNHPGYAKAETIAEMTLDVMDSILELAPLFPDNESLEGWKMWMRTTFSESPIVCKQLERRRDWYLRVGPIYEDWKKNHKRDDAN